MAAGYILIQQVLRIIKIKVVTYSQSIINFSATSMSVNQYGNTHCLSYPNGQVLWVPPAQFSAVCEFNLKYWPFDSQTCYFVFGSWTYHGNMVDLNLHNYSKMGLEVSLISSICIKYILI